jgi:hypothetical protein
MIRPFFNARLRMIRNFLALLTLLVPLLAVAEGVAYAQAVEFVGTAECTGCHDAAGGRDHRKQLDWSEKYDGGADGKLHKNALIQLKAPKFKEKFDAYAKALDPPVAVPAKDKYCLGCHATEIDGRAAAGVTCQSCHGPGSRYLKPHQQANSYQAAVGLGMRDIIQKPQNWVGECLKCHVLGRDPDKDARIIAAGHPSGADFNVGAKAVTVPGVSGPGHWNSLINEKSQKKYTAAEINAIANPLKADLLKGLKTGPTSPPAVEKEKPPPAGPDTPDKPPTAGPTPGPEKPGPVIRPPGTPPGRGPILPVPPAPPISRGPAAPPPVSAPRPPRDPATLTPVGIVASIQGRLASLLDSLLARGVTLPKPVTPKTPRPTYKGADGELLRLQQEAIDLALEVLGTSPIPAAAR